MKFVILNGSPRETKSVTYQYLRYIEANFPMHEYMVHHIGRKIKKIEKDQEYFDLILKDIEAADGIIWIYPVYILSVPSQLKRFIELVFERKKLNYFKGKNATSISTSGKFYDHLAHNYIHAISEDFGMNYFRGYSAEIMELLKKKERKRLQNFAIQFFIQCENKLESAKVCSPLIFDYPAYNPSKIKVQPKTKKHKITVLTDASETDESLNNMIDTFVKLMPCEVLVVNVNKVNIKGGCLGCLNCASENICFYPDEHNAIFKKYTVEVDAVVFAYKTQDRYLSSGVKIFQDRSFFNGHHPVFMGQQQAFFISGPLRQMPILREAIEAMPEVGRANLVGIVTDEYTDSKQITTLIQNVIDGILWGIEHGKYTRPKTFLGVGGHKVFRDLIHTYQVVFPQDYSYYKMHKLFDWPKIFFGNFSFILKPLMRFPSFRKRFFAQSGKFLIQMFSKVIKKEDADKTKK
ncbi:MAG: NAD(P)H-dependent oxidoreductase [Candidatus Heimdallarchaeota archaeon]|nr:NAD(P)H-dependent oxidoreductase [Candidatus Heimdallarchaeota archaeon]